MFLVFSVVFFALFVFILCVVYPMLPVSLDCPFLIAPSVFLSFIVNNLLSFFVLLCIVPLFFIDCLRNKELELEPTSLFSIVEN